MEQNENTCQICEDEASKYSCPRCSLRYCSVKCYQHQKHADCSEKFYKMQVLNELKDMKGDGEKEKVMNILKKLKTQDESARNVDDVTEISERLVGVDLDDADVVWGKLTSDEQDLFRRYVDKGKLDFMPMWTPWWTIKKRSKVVDISKKDKRSKKIPQIIKDLPNLKDIIGDNIPNNDLKFCVLDIILTYTCTQRIFNGDMYDSPYETVNVILQLSKVLSENKVYSDLNSCIYCFIDDLNTISDIGVDPVDVCLEDLRHIVTSNDSYVVRVLSDFYTYLKKCQKFFKKENEDLSQQLFKIWKKVYFYAVYCGEYETDLKILGDGIREIQRHLLKEREIVQKGKELIEENFDKLKPKEEKPLIEEI